jgi:succinate-semialdehyde dehydrogenase/glutarate-semialdehyde dehydrogenase
MELGGDAPFIVFEDADIDAAVEGAMASKYRNAGQTCVCANRMIIHSSVATEFATKLAEKVSALKVGNGLQPGIEVGPLINEAAMSKVCRLVDQAIEQGATALTGGSKHEAGDLFFQPTVLTNVKPDMAIANEEIFGPVAPIMTYENEEEAIALANDTPYGLAAYFYTNDLGRAWRVSEGLEYGMVALNTGALSNVAAPFGGVKQSGIGREGSHHGIDEYLELKYVCMAGLGS